MVNLREIELSVFVCCLVLAGCGDPLDRQVGLADLENPNPTVRIMAIKWAGENKIKAAVPRLVDTLEDEDPAVRFYAIEGLRRITGTDNGYDYKTSARERAASVKRWREFLNTEEWPKGER
jgi:HEAT repeat protein